jgi:predicted dehydrogenase
MEVGIIGCGRNTEDMHIPAIKGINGLNIKGICDKNKERLKNFAQKHGIKDYFYEPDTFFNFCSDVDFIIISTPGFTHFDLCKEALDRKFNVLVEKPVTLNLKDAIRLKDMAKRHKRQVGVIQNYRYREPVIKAKKAQIDGIVGKITQFNATFHGQSIFNEPTSWSWEERKHKILLFELMIHLLDLQVYFAGPVKKIIGCHTKVDRILDTTTNVYALVEHENQAIGIVDFQLFSSSNYIGFELFGTANDIKIKLQPHYLRIYSGTVNPIDEIYYDWKRIWDFGLKTFKDKLFKPKVSRRVHSHYELIKLFAECIKRQQPFPVGIDNVVPTMHYVQMLSDLVYGNKKI